MDLGGTAPVRRSLASRERREADADQGILCRRGGEFAVETTPQKPMEAVVRDLTKLRAMGSVTGDAGKEKILSRVVWNPDGFRRAANYFSLGLRRAVRDCSWGCGGRLKLWTASGILDRGGARPLATLAVAQGAATQAEHRSYCIYCSTKVARGVFSSCLRH